MISKKNIFEKSIFFQNQNFQQKKSRPIFQNRKFQKSKNHFFCRIFLITFFSKIFPRKSTFSKLIFVTIFFFNFFLHFFLNRQTWEHFPSLKLITHELIPRRNHLPHHPVARNVSTASSVNKCLLSPSNKQLLLYKGHPYVCRKLVSMVFPEITLLSHWISKTFQRFADPEIFL